MGDGVVYVIDKNNEIVEEFNCDYDTAINTYWGKRTQKGRYHVGVKGIEVPYKRKGKNLKDIKPIHRDS